VLADLTGADMTAASLRLDVNWQSGRYLDAARGNSPNRLRQVYWSLSCKRLEILSALD
jgi:hypothetical protein